MHHLSHPFEIRSDRFHITSKGDIFTVIREANLAEHWWWIGLGLHFQGSGIIVKCNLWRIGAGRCLVSGSLHPTWSLVC